VQVRVRERAGCGKQHHHTRCHHPIITDDEVVPERKETAK
jgi:hypothetical protein